MTRPAGTPNRSRDETNAIKTALYESMIEWGGVAEAKSLRSRLRSKYGYTLNSQELRNFLMALVRREIVQQETKGWYELTPMHEDRWQDCRDRLTERVYGVLPTKAAKDPFPKITKLADRLGMRIGYFSTPGAEVAA